MSTTRTPSARERDARLRRRHLGQRGEDDVDAAGELRLDGHVQPRQVGQGVAEFLAGLAASGDADDLGVGVAVEDAGELDARVAGDVDDANFH